MKKLFLITFYFVLICSILSCKNKLETENVPLILYENYQIDAEKDETSIEAVVFFQPNILENDKKFFPQEITYNGDLMERTELRGYVGPSFSITENNGQTQLKPSNFDINKKTTGYSIKLPSFNRKSSFVVTDINGNKRELDFEFDPTEFEKPDDIFLSRTKDNYIKITGQCSDEKDCSVGIGAESGDIDEDLIKIDFLKKQIIIPAGVTKNLKDDTARIYIISRHYDYTNKLFESNRNIYLVPYGRSLHIVYSTDAIAKIIK